MKKIGVILGVAGGLCVWCGAEGCDTGLEDKLWCAAVIIGMLLLIFGIMSYRYGDYLERERAKKSIRYRRRLEFGRKYE